MLVSSLCKNLEVKILGPDVNIKGLDNDNRNILPGYAFFCISGYVTDGHKFAQKAVDNGASCLFVEHKLPINVTQVVCKNTREVMGYVSSAFYNYPSKHKNIVGVTGTNGKTTITHIIDHVLGDSCVIGTNGIELHGKKIDYSGRTTPESFQLQKLFSEIDTDNIVMEVSSHALVLDRVTGTKFAVTAFSNLTQDHLDYHKTIENYFEAKAMLFSDKFPAKRVICIDDKWGRILYERCKGKNCISVGLSKDAMYNPTNVKVNFPLVGKFNIQNMLIAYAVCKQLGVKNIEKKLESTPSVAGRMQKVGDRYIVDYAHTPDALENAIKTLKEVADNRVITVFGCGGDRDKDKRSKMGKISELYSDYTIVTSDNPRSEDPNKIIDDITIDMRENYSVIPDRASAIKEAIKMSSDGDIVLVAGKGHEKTQTIGDKVIHFDDVEVIENEIER